VRTARRGGFVARLDRNGDGKVSRSEFDGPPEHFDHFDRDGDGYITEDEAARGPPPRR
jgi:Ca2+-binding EF-hand superfamily protein